MCVLVLLSVSPRDTSWSWSSRGHDYKCVCVCTCVDCDDRQRILAAQCVLTVSFGVCVCVNGSYIPAGVSDRSPFEDLRWNLFTASVSGLFSSVLKIRCNVVMALTPDCLVKSYRKSQRGFMRRKKTRAVSQDASSGMASESAGVC